MSIRRIVRRNLEREGKAKRTRGHRYKLGQRTKPAGWKDLRKK